MGIIRRFLQKRAAKNAKTTKKWRDVVKSQTKEYKRKARLLEQEIKGEERFHHTKERGLGPESWSLKTKRAHLRRLQKRIEKNEKILQE